MPAVVRLEFLSMEGAEVRGRCRTCTPFISFLSCIKNPAWTFTSSRAMQSLVSWQAAWSSTSPCILRVRRKISRPGRLGAAESIERSKSPGSKGKKTEPGKSGDRYPALPYWLISCLCCVVCFDMIDFPLSRNPAKHGCLELFWFLVDECIRF